MKASIRPIEGAIKRIGERDRVVEGTVKSLMPNYGIKVKANLELSATLWH